MNCLKATTVSLMILLASSLASAQHAAAASGTVSGNWAITFTIQGQTASGTLALEVKGETLTGTIESHHTGPGSLRDGTYSAAKLSATCVFEHHDSIALTGELQGDKLVGKFHTEGMDGTWEATRISQSATAPNRR